MKSIAVAALLGLIKTASAACAGTWYANDCDTSFGGSFEIQYGWEVPLLYGTTYYAGKGPYDSDVVFTNIDDTMHFEEYGFTASLDIHAYSTFSFYDQSSSPVYQFTIGGHADVFDITPYKQVLWWQNFMEDLINSQSFATHVWVGGAYEVSFGAAYIYYVESALTQGANVFEELDTQTSWWNTYPAGSYENTWTWYDTYYTVDVIDYLPQDVQDMVGEEEYYNKQLF